MVAELRRGVRVEHRAGLVEHVEANAQVVKVFTQITSKHLVSCQLSTYMARAAVVTSAAESTLSSY